MKHTIILAVLLICCAAYGQNKRDRERIFFNDTTKVLFRERTVVLLETIDTLRILQDIARERAGMDAAKARVDSLTSQLRTARKFYRKAIASRDAQVPEPAPIAPPKQPATEPVKAPKPKTKKQ